MKNIMILPTIYWDADLWEGGKSQVPAKIYQHVINMYWTDISTHSSIRICAFIAVFVILSLFASQLHIDNAAKDALFAMYA
jgi:hypothetical protein